MQQPTESKQLIIPDQKSDSTTATLSQAAGQLGFYKSQAPSNAKDNKQPTNTESISDNNLQLQLNPSSNPKTDTSQSVSSKDSTIIQVNKTICCIQ